MSSWVSEVEIQRLSCLHKIELLKITHVQVRNPLITPIAITYGRRSLAMKDWVAMLSNFRTRIFRYRSIAYWNVTWLGLSPNDWLWYLWERYGVQRQLRWTIRTEACMSRDSLNVMKVLSYHCVHTKAVLLSGKGSVPWWCRMMKAHPMFARSLRRLLQKVTILAALIPCALNTSVRAIGNI